MTTKNGDGRVYAARRIKRGRPTKAQVEQLDRQIVAEVEADHPQSIRHVFYRMTDPRLPEPVEKSDAGYERVQRRLTVLRRKGKVPYDWIADASRQGYFVTTYAGAGDFLGRVAGMYRADLWEGTGHMVEVWVESRSIAGVILRDCKELAVALYPAGGFSSITFAYEAAEEINAWHEGRKVHVFYVGDYDPAGVLIDVTLENELRRHLNDGVNMVFERVGITTDQIEEYSLPGKPRKEGDRRSPHVLETVEAEAMPAHILRRLLRVQIEALLPRQALNAAKAAEAGEREAIRKLAAALDRGDVNPDDLDDVDDDVDDDGDE